MYLFFFDLRIMFFTLLPGHQATPLLIQLFPQASNTTETSCFKEPEAHLQKEKEIAHKKKTDAHFLWRFLFLYS